MDTSSTAQVAQILGQTLKILWYLSNENFMDTHWENCYGKDNSRKCCWNLDWKKYQFGMSVCSSKTKYILISIRRCHQNGWKKQESQGHVEETDETG